MKRCAGCGEVKPIDSFFRNASSPDGRYSRCKACHQEAKYDTCECGARKWKRAAYCDTCARRVRRGVDRVAIIGHVNTGRSRAQARFELGGRCEYPDCKAPPIDRHHIDGNVGNNSPENIARYCRRHHMLVDGRLAQLAAQAQMAGKRAAEVRWGAQ